MKMDSEEDNIELAKFVCQLSKNVKILSIDRKHFSIHCPLWCTIKILRGGGVVDGEGDSSEGCLKWGGGGSLRDLSKNILKQGVGKGKSCS